MKLQYLDWGLGVAAVCTSGVFILLRATVEKSFVIMACLALMWHTYALLVSPYALNLSYHIHFLVISSGITVMALFIVQYGFSSRSGNQAIKLTAWAWVLINVVLLIGWYTGHVEYAKHKFSGMFANRNSFAQSTVIISSLVLFFTTGRSRKLLVALGSILVFASLSITGFLTLFFLLLYKLFRNSGIKIKTCIILCCIGGTVIFFYIENPIQHRIHRFVLALYDPEQLRESESASLRSWLYADSLRQSFQRPITGVGIDNARFVLIPPTQRFYGMDKGLYAHSNYLEILVNTGYPGLILHYFPILFVAWVARKRRSDHYRAHTFAMLYLLFSATSVTYNSFTPMLLYVLVLYSFFNPKTTIKINAQDTLHRQHPSRFRSHKSVIQHSQIS